MGCFVIVLARFYTKIQALHEASGNRVDNPLLAYTLIKRLQSDWLNVVFSREANENIQGMKELLERLCLPSRPGGGGGAGNTDMMGQTRIQSP